MDKYLNCTTAHASAQWWAKRGRERKRRDEKNYKQTNKEQTNGKKSLYRKRHTVYVFKACFPSEFYVFTEYIVLTNDNNNNQIDHEQVQGN